MIQWRLVYLKTFYLTFHIVLLLFRAVMAHVSVMIFWYSAVGSNTVVFYRNTCMLMR